MMKLRRNTQLGVWLLVAVKASYGFVVTRKGRVTSTLLGSLESEDDVNGSAAAMVPASDSKSQLFSAFSALTAADQYDAVLTGLCAKILDTNEEEQVSLEDPLQLLQEMNGKRIQASPRSTMALIDSTVKAQDGPLMARVMSACRQNGSAMQYGTQQTDILPWPVSADSRVTINGKVLTRNERLETVDPLPVDERGKEVSSALAVGGVALACQMTNILGWNDISPFANLILTSLVLIGVLDNFYDLVQTGSSMAAQKIAKQDVNLPEKSSLPLGLGSGQVTGTVVRGFNRLLTSDAERQALCEAAALLAAYTTGLPCYAYRPNSLEASVLVVESLQSSTLDNLATSSGVLRMLVWLVAPVAAESMKYPVCILSDYQQAGAFLDRLEEAAETNTQLRDAIFWDTNERDDLIQWAYTEADLFLRANSQLLQTVTERLTGGAATIGDCVAVLEEW